MSMSYEVLGDQFKKVIAEKDEEIAKLKKLNDKYANAIYRLEQQLKKADKR